MEVPDYFEQMLTNFSTMIDMPEQQILDFVAEDILGLEDDLPSHAVPDFIAGFIDGVTGHNHQSEIEACYYAPGAKHLDMEIQTGVKLMKGSLLSNMGAAPFFLGMIATFPKALMPCGEIEGLTQDEIACLTLLAGLAKPPQDLGFALTKTVMTNTEKVSQHKIDVPTNWDKKMYMESGQALAELIKLLLNTDESENTISELLDFSFLN